MKKILLLTTSNLATNPRLLKEALYLKSLDFEIKIVAFKIGGWSEITDERLVGKHGFAIQYLSALRKPVARWFFSSIIQKVSHFLSLVFNSKAVMAYTISKRSWLLWNYLKRSNVSPDFIIAHNIGALYPSWKMSLKRNIPFAFDVEDYHPGEGVLKGRSTVSSRCKENIMRDLLPKARYVSFASPLIMKECIKLCQPVALQKVEVINNSFPTSEFVRPGMQLHNSKEDDKLQVVWFSQNINHSRGLEQAIEALEPMIDNVSLTLIGESHQPFYDHWISPNNHFIKVISPISQEELNTLLCSFDVGLAIELNSADFNRQICLTNKIWAYFQAGLFILATDTPSQIQFLSEHSNHGRVCKQGVEDIRSHINDLVKRRAEIRSSKLKRYSYAQSFAWDSESLKINKLIGS